MEEEYIDPKLCFSEEHARNYGSSPRMRKVQKEMALRALDFIPRDSRAILDAGCGTGIGMEALIEKGYDVKGVDIAPAMLNIAMGKGLDVRLADLRNTGFANKSFDAVISISAMQWHSGKDINDIYDHYRKVAGEFRRLLREGGRAVSQYYPHSPGEREQCLKAFRKLFSRVVEVTDKAGTKEQKIYVVAVK